MQRGIAAAALRAMTGRNGIATKAALAGAVLALAAAFVAMPAHAQNRIPKDALAFVKWCAERGFETKDATGDTCSNIIADHLDMAIGLGSLDIDACERLYMRANRPDDVERLYARPVYEWLRANPQRIRGTIRDAAWDALRDLYGC